MARVMPRTWSEDEFRAATEIGLERFIDQRTAEGGSIYNTIFDDSLPLVEQVFDRSHNLTEIRASTFVGAPQLVDPARFLTAPPVSRDDLKTLCGGRTSVKTAGDAKKVADVIRHNLDERRYPWLARRRQPTAQERAGAQRWTASIWAIEQARTLRRTTAGKRQEEAVEALLLDLDFKRSQEAHERADTGGPIRDIRRVDALRPGTFRRETPVAGTKADVPVRLKDGRLLAIECKESNTAINSTKRLNRETGGKAGVWKQEFGNQVVSMAVIAGIFHVSDLLRAQDDQGVFIVWEHDFDPLTDFLKKAA